MKCYMRRYERFLHLAFYRKRIPNELKDIILSYI